MPSDAQGISPQRIFQFDADYLPAFTDKLFIEGPNAPRRTVNFFVLLLLATVIATFGVLSNSTATVIGAMIVAPLMGPIMATAAAGIMGETRRLLRALTLVGVGVVAVIALAALLTLIVPEVTISIPDNPEIVSRISPGLSALITALAAGAAGAFIITRAELADSMGGVAIAISLVPPLCVVGITLARGDVAAAGGAMLLFMTNFLAILLAGGLVFLLSGLGRLASSAERARARRTVYALVILGTIFVTLLLTAHTARVVRNAGDTQRATATVQHWLTGTTGRLVIVKVADELVQVTVEAMADIPPAQDLANIVATALGRPVAVELRVVPVRRDTAAGAVAGGR